MANFFIDRPIFAWVLAILLCLTGTLAIFSLPVEQYPDLAPPNVRVTANYPGASAQTLENTVTQVIEQNSYLFWAHEHCRFPCKSGNNNTHIKNKVFTTKKEGRYESFYYGQQSAMSGLSCL
jgi:Cu/Ag efflux pump CusA